MKYSVLLAALLAVSMTACSKKEETVITPAPEAAMPAPDSNTTVNVPPSGGDTTVIMPPAPEAAPAPDAAAPAPAPDAAAPAPAPAQ